MSVIERFSQKFLCPRCKTLVDYKSNSTIPPKRPTVYCPHCHNKVNFYCAFWNKPLSPAAVAAQSAAEVRQKCGTKRNRQKGAAGVQSKDCLKGSELKITENKNRENPQIKTEINSNSETAAETAADTTSQSAANGKTTSSKNAWRDHFFHWEFPLINYNLDFFDPSRTYNMGSWKKYFQDYQGHTICAHIGSKVEKLIIMLNQSVFANMPDVNRDMTKDIAFKIANELSKLGFELKQENIERMQPNHNGLDVSWVSWLKDLPYTVKTNLLGTLIKDNSKGLNEFEFLNRKQKRDNFEDRVQKFKDFGWVDFVEYLPDDLLAIKESLKFTVIAFEKIAQSYANMNNASNSNQKLVKTQDTGDKNGASDIYT